MLSETLQCSITRLFSARRPAQVHSQLCITLNKSIPLGATSLTWKYCVADASSVRWLNTEHFFFSSRHLFKVFENALNSARRKKETCVYTLETREFTTALYKIPTEKILEDYNSMFIPEHTHDKEWQGGNGYYSEV